MKLRRTFQAGRMNSDADNRTIPNGEYRDAHNIVILNNQGSNEGVLQKALSNKRLTNLNLGANPILLGEYSYEARNRIYWLVVSDNGAYLCEWDHNSQTATFVLQDTRAVGERVFDLKEDKLCTAIAIVPTDNPDDELLLMTDNNLPPLCINISRAKTYEENGFDIDDIQLIKKPPRFGPTTQLTYVSGPNNTIKENFFTFCYRYRYLDGEYSAFSDMTEYQFAPGKSKLDYLTVEQLGMVNNFNAIRLGFNTGDKRVTDIQLLFKKSNRNEVFIIESFNKEDEFWGNDEVKYFTFTNNKNYVALPEWELYRLYDNVPIQALAMCVVENRVFFSNYKEGYNMIDANGRKVKPEFSLDIISNDLSGEVVPVDINGTTEDGGDLLTFSLSGLTLAKDTLLRFDLVLKSAHEEGPDTIIEGGFANLFDFILNRDYADAADLAEDPEFILFVTDIMQSVFIANYTLDPPADSTLDTIVGFAIDSFTSSTITLKAPVFTYEIDDTPGDPEDTDFSYIDYNWHFFEDSVITFREFAVASSLHSNRSYEVGMLYKDDAKRSTTALTCANNTVYIPQSLSVFQNKLKITVDHLPPAWADTFKFVVKQNTLTYYTIYGVLFYTQGPFVWVRLDGANKDKVNKDDILILKADLAGPRADVLKVAVIDVVLQEENFISGNAEPSGAEIKEEAGLYMKIKGEGISMDVDGTAYFYYNRSARGEQYIDLGGILQYVDEDSGDYVDYPVKAGSRIRIKFFCDPTESGAPTTDFEKEYIAQGEYDNFEDWFSAEFGGYGESADDFTITFSRDGNNKLIARFESEYSFLANDIRATIEVTRTETYVVFETEPTNDTPEVYFESSQSFTFTDGYHNGNLQDQDAASPAIIELDFFNCFAFGDGVESYRIKDLVKKPSLNIDLKPTTTSAEPYRQMARPCDITYSEPYVESSGLNGLNVFNTSTGNFKDDMEKQYGAAMKLHPYRGNILVMQEEKIGQVNHGKRTITTPTGEETVAAIGTILGDYNSYQGDYGIGKHPESFSVDDQGRVKWACVKKGVVARLSNDGIELITYGKRDFFRDVFMEQPNAKILSGFDPYLNQTVFAIGNEPERLIEFTCGAMFIKEAQTGAFTYEFKLNSLGGDIVLNYNITVGTATITAVFNSVTHVVSNVTGAGNLTFERTSLVQNTVTVTITPVGGAISYMMANLCPTGTELKIVSLVLNDSADTGTTMTDRFKRTGSAFLTTPEVFTDPPLTRFETITGTEGTGIFPVNGELVTIQAFRDNENTGHFATSECNRLAYLISDIVYEEADYQDILDNADTEFLSVTTTGEEGAVQTSTAQFVFNRTDADQILYLIWDYTSRNPVILDDSANVNIGQTVNINVLANDDVGPTAVVTIGTPPENGTATVLVDRTIDYTHDGSDNLSDTFTYVVTEGGCSSTAIVTITVGISCGDTLTASGGVGIYEVAINFGTATGWCGVEVNAQSIPDRFQLLWDDVIVADSKYIGDSITAGPPTSYTGLLGAKTLDVYEYDGAAFVDTGVDESFTVIQSDIADNVTEPINGNRMLTFNKTTALPATVKLRVFGPVGGTAWDLNDVYCPTMDVIEGNEKCMYGFFIEMNKDHVSTSVGLFLNTAETRFYTNRFGGTNFTIFGFTETNNYINNGTQWFAIDEDGFVIDQGAI